MQFGLCPCWNIVCMYAHCAQLGPNADDIMWQEVQMGIADVKFGARDAKEKNKVCVSPLTSNYSKNNILFCSDMHVFDGNSVTTQHRVLYLLYCMLLVLLFSFASAS